jgi:hypothetical protein
MLAPPWKRLLLAAFKAEKDPEMASQHGKPGSTAHVQSQQLWLPPEVVKLLYTLSSPAQSQLIRLISHAE